VTSYTDEDTDRGSSVGVFVKSGVVDLYE